MFALNLFWRWTSKVLGEILGVRLCVTDELFPTIALSDEIDETVAAVTFDELDDFVLLATSDGSLTCA